MSWSHPGNRVTGRKIILRSQEAGTLGSPWVVGLGDGLTVHERRGWRTGARAPEGAPSRGWDTKILPRRREGAEDWVTAFSEGRDIPESVFPSWDQHKPALLEWTRDGFFWEGSKGTETRLGEMPAASPSAPLPFSFSLLLPPRSPEPLPPSL